MTLNGGRLTGSGILAGSVDCNALVSPGSNSIGTITIQGSLRLRPDARVLVQINGDQSYDRLTVTGSATLDGTLEASLVDDFYPAARSSFPWCNGSAREGRFATFLFPSDDVGMRDRESDRRAGRSRPFHPLCFGFRPAGQSTHVRVGQRPGGNSGFEFGWTGELES